MPLTVRWKTRLRVVGVLLVEGALGWAIYEVVQTTRTTVRHFSSLHSETLETAHELRRLLTAAERARQTPDADPAVIRETRQQLARRLDIEARLARLPHERENVGRVRAEVLEMAFLALLIPLSVLELRPKSSRRPLRRRRNIPA